MTECIAKKIEFVKALNDVYVKYQGNIDKIEYRVFKNKKFNYMNEWLVVEYRGGSFSAICCSGNSYAAIAAEITKCLYDGVYDQNDYFETLVTGEDWEEETV